MRKTSLIAGSFLTVTAAGLAALAYGRALDRRIRGKVVLVTGGSRGLGFVLARHFLELGCRVAICARDREALAEAENRLGALTGRAEHVTSIVCDVSSDEQCRAMAEEIRQRFGPVDILVNNAGIIDVGSVPHPRRADLEAGMDVCFWGVVNCTYAVLPHFEHSGRGRIINITSIGGVVPVPHMVPYVSAKFAAVGFSKTLSIELARRGIQVTTIIPGLMRTGSFFNAFFHDPADREYAWFALGASLPVISMSADRAARKIIRAGARGKPQAIIGLPARLGTIFASLAPNLTVRMARLVDRMLPRDPMSFSSGGSLPVAGYEVDLELREQRGFRFLTGLGRRSAENYQPVRWRVTGS